LKKFTENDTPLKRSTVPRAGVELNLQWGTVERNYSAHNGLGLISIFHKNWVSHQNNKQFYICFLGREIADVTRYSSSCSFIN